MFKSITFALGVLAVVIVFTSGVRAEEATSRGRSAQAHALVKAGATLLDVRTPQEYAAGHAEGAVNIPIDVLAGRISELPKDRKVVVYCHSGRRSGEAVTILKKAGRDVFDLKKLSDW